jgi:hypothetical protein
MQKNRASARLAGSWLAALTLAVSALLTACTTTGMGGGQLMGAGADEQAVVFTWRSTDGAISGTMNAQLPNETYTGRFFQITRQTRSEVLAPLWTHWSLGWYDWPYWGGVAQGPYPYPYPTVQFITHYSGKVVATLESPGNQRLRCRFHLAEPARGMLGGGEGECQLTGGRVVRALFEAQ